MNTPPKKRKVKTSADGYYTQTEIALLLKTNYQTLQTAIRDGLPVRADGKISLAEAKDWYRTKHEVRETGAQLRHKLLAQELKTKRTKHELAEVELSEKRGELHPIKDCVASLGAILTTVNREIQALPARAQAAMPEAVGLEKVLTEIVNDAAVRIRDYAKEKGAKLE